MTEIEQQIWDGKLHSRINASYYRKRLLFHRRFLFALDIGAWTCSTLSVAQWIHDTTSLAVPFLAFAAALSTTLSRQLQLPQRITKLEHCIGVWDKQAKEYNALWLRAHEKPGSVTAGEITRLRGYDPPDMEGEVARSDRALETAKSEVFSGQKVATEDTK